MNSTNSILIEGQSILFQTRVHPRSRRLRMTINQSGELVVSVPRWASRHTIENFVSQHSRWIIKTIDQMKNSVGFLPGIGNVEEYKQMKEGVRAYVERRIEELNAPYGFSFNRVSIRNQRSRWGSCSAKGNLNFSYRIALLPPHLADYIIVHELCHLREHNHSKRFWDLVSQTIPDYREYRKQLRTGTMKDE